MPEKPDLEEVEQAVRTLIRWAGDDDTREGLRDTPRRVAESYREFFAGYSSNPDELLRKTFTEIEGYDEIILLRDIRFESYCEHHMVPIVGHAHVAYLPDKRVVGISKLARVVDIYAKRLQIQEKLTVQIASSINMILKPRGVAVILAANHQCISMRGIYKPGVVMQTSHMTGCFKEDKNIRQELFTLIGAPLNKTW